MADRPTIIAVDFDGCLCRNAWPEIGEAREDVIRALLERQKRGAKIILWTCRVGERLADAVQWCAERGITFDAVNANLPVNIAAFGNDCRKIYADEYWDDKARDPEICDVSIPSQSKPMSPPPLIERNMGGQINEISMALRDTLSQYGTGISVHATLAAFNIIGNELKSVVSQTADVGETINRFGVDMHGKVIDKNKGV